MKYALKYTAKEDWYVSRSYAEGGWEFAPLSKAILYDTMGDAVQAIAERARRPGIVNYNRDMRDMVIVGVIEEAPPPPVLTRKEVLL